jgi:predicted transcriptional regulator
MAKSFDQLVKRTTNKRTRDLAAKRTQELLEELLVSEVRKLAGKSQQELADALGIKQPSLSKLEKQSDMQISTLRRIVQALGGELEVVARFPKRTIKLRQFSRA